MGEDALMVGDFEDLACIAYNGADAPERRRAAAAMLAGDPSLSTATLAGAAVTANVGAIRAHLDADASCHSQSVGSRSWPAILYLCYSRVEQDDPLGALDMLLDAGADPNAHFVAWGSRFTAITGAIGQGEQGPARLPSHPDAEAMVTRLLDAGASPNDCQALYNTMLDGDIGWLTLMLSHGLNADHVITWPIAGNPRTVDFVLANAADHGDLERIDLLLAHGANPDCVSPYNGRPIHTNALVSGRDAAARRLVEAGATMTELDAVQQFERAVNLGDIELAREVLTPEMAADPRHILAASASGELEVVQLLVASGAKPHSTDHAGVTPLHRAAWDDHVQVVRFLLDNGADPSVRDHTHGATPHDWAVRNASAHAAALLENETPVRELAASSRP